MSLSKARQLARDLGTVGISSSGTSIHTSVATLNFVGAGNTFAVHNDQVDISIEGGGGTKAGEAIDYPSGTKSPFILNTVVISESITLGNSNSGTGAANIVTGESMITVDDSVTITVEDGKKVIPDLFNVFDTPERFRN
tara:strand:- start:224 stop:640 length:417 start_codon:yes stop_codon:yes gene_type:complete